MAQKEVAQEMEENIRARELKGPRLKRVKEVDSPRPIEEKTFQQSSGFKRIKVEEANECILRFSSLGDEKRYSRSLEQKNARLLELLEAERAKVAALKGSTQEEKQKHLKTQNDLRILKEKNDRQQMLVVALRAELVEREYAENNFEPWLRIWCRKIWWGSKFD